MSYLRALRAGDGPTWGVLIGLTIIAAMVLYAFMQPTYDGPLDPDSPWALENLRYQETPILWNQLVEERWRTEPRAT